MRITALTAAADIYVALSDNLQRWGDRESIAYERVDSALRECGGDLPPFDVCDHCEELWEEAHALSEGLKPYFETAYPLLHRWRHELDGCCRA